MAMQRVTHPGGIYVLIVGIDSVSSFFPLPPPPHRGVGSGAWRNACISSSEASSVPLGRLPRHALAGGRGRRGLVGLRHHDRLRLRRHLEGRCLLLLLLPLLLLPLLLLLLLLLQLLRICWERAASHPFIRPRVSERRLGNRYGARTATRGKRKRWEGEGGAVACRIERVLGAEVYMAAEERLLIALCALEARAQLQFHLIVAHSRYHSETDDTPP